MSSKRSRNESVGDSLCPVCQEHSEIYAFGTCDHYICYKCSTRMRVLCDQMYCPICRGDLPQIVFLTRKEKYATVNRRDCIPNRKYKILMEDETVEDAFEALLEHRCRLCEKGPLFNNFTALQQHMSRIHQRFACDLCTNHLKIFPFERKFYSRKDLATHRRTGDSDNRSYRGHPLCKFCDERFFDNDELLRHLRKSHYFCHFCDADANSNEYFDDYPDLKQHFRMEHFMCEEGECGSRETRFTNAFASDIDLQAHKMAEHLGNKSKAQMKELRSIDLNFQVAPRRRGRDAGVVTPNDYEEVGNTGRGHRDQHSRRNENRGDYYSRPSNPSPPPAAAAATAQPPSLVEDFPTLGNKPAPYIPAVARPAGPVDDFPSLAPQRTSGATSITGSSRPASKKPDKKQKQAVNNFASVSAAVASGAGNKPYSGSSQSSIPNGAKSHPSEPKRAQQSTWSQAKISSTDDFPTLGKESKGKVANGGPNFVSLGTWSKKQKEEASSRPSSASNGMSSHSQTKKSSSLAALGRTLWDEGEDFPSLGGGSRDVGGASWMQKNNLSTVKSRKNNSNSALGKTRDPAAVPKHKQDQPEYYDPLSYRDSCKDSEKETESFPEDTSKSKKKKKKQKEKEAKSSTEDSGISLSSIASELEFASTFPEPCEKKTESASAVTDWFEKKSEVKSEDLSPRLPKSLPVSSNKETKVKAKTSPREESPMETKTSPREVPVVEAEGKENQQWTKKGTKKNKALQEEDFPSLSAGPRKTALGPGRTAPSSAKSSTSSGKTAPSSAKSAPPPGFQKPNKISAPPPGLSKPASSSLTLSSLAADLTSAPSPASLPMSINLGLYSYVAPIDAPARNRAMVALVRDLLEPKFAGFDQFRSLSADFRGGNVSGKEYHRKCQDLFGKEAFLMVLPELVALLPDIQKQNDLNQAHGQSMLGICAPLDLVSCPTCRQLLKGDDLAYHLAACAGLTSDISAFPSSAAAFPIQT